MLKRIILLLIIANGSIYAQNRVDQLIDSLTVVNSHEEKARLSQDIAWELKDTDWERTLKYLDYSEDESKAASNTEEALAKFYIASADVYYHKDVLDVALAYFQKAYNIYNQNNNNQEKLKLENNLAIIYARLNNKVKAQYYFKKVFDYQAKEKDSVYMAQILNNMGTLYINDIPDSSIVYYNKSLKIAKKDNLSLFAYLYTNLGRAYYLKDEPIIAQEYFEKSIALSKKELNENTKGYVYQMVSKYYFESHQNDSAIYYAKKTIELLDNNKYSFSYQDVIHTLYNVYLDEENYKQASEYFELYNEIRDSINVEEKAVNVERLKLEQEYKTKNQIRTLKEDQKKFKYSIIVLSLISGLLILFIMLIKYRNKLINAQFEKKLVDANRNELNASLELKNKVLIAKAMTEIHRTEIIQGILEDLKHLKLKAVKKETQLAIDYILKRLEKNTDSSIWNEFEISFEQVHESFYKNLNNLHPDLTSKDRRLCALLILNLTSKEISQITGQSFKSVENARTRLRKKLKLTNTKTDLTTYLNSHN